MADSTVKNLKEFAFLAVFKDIVYDLLRVRRRHPNGRFVKRRKVDHLHGTSNRAVVDGVRAKLDAYLVGAHYSPFRQRLLELYRVQSSEMCPDLRLFLQCVLDDSFTELKLSSQLFRSAADRTTTHSVDLITLVALHCSNLRSLHVQNCERWEFTMKMEPILTNSLSKLKYLTKLELSFTTSGDCVPFFTQVGTCCPKLEEMTLVLSSGKPIIGKDQILALVLGERTRHLKASTKDELFGEDSHLHRLQFASDHITPICSSLQHFRLLGEHNRNVWKNIIEFKWSCVLLFRHMPRLQGDLHMIIDSSLELLHDLKNKTLPQIQKGDRNLKWTINAPPPQSLNLDKLDSINVCSRIPTLNALISMCPHLKSIVLVSLYSRNRINTTPQQLRTVFDNKLPKMESLTFHAMPGDYTQAMLSTSIGRRLTKLNFSAAEYFHQYVDLAHLLPCVSLQELKIGAHCTVSLSVASAGDDRLLPSLKKLVTGCCLGEWSCLFERKRPSLTCLNLSCSHIGIPEASDYDWSDIPSLWPGLEQLYINLPTKGLHLNQLPTIIGQMDCLKKLQLPIPSLVTSRPSEEEKQQAEKMVTEFKQSKTALLTFRHPVQSRFARSNCSFHYTQLEGVVIL